MATTFECLHCGRDVIVGRLACAECGSDARTGWWIGPVGDEAMRVDDRPPPAVPRPVAMRLRGVFVLGVLWYSVVYACNFDVMWMGWQDDYVERRHHYYWNSILPVVASCLVGATFVFRIPLLVCVITATAITARNVVALRAEGFTPTFAVSDLLPLLVAWSAVVAVVRVQRASRHMDEKRAGVHPC